MKWFLVALGIILLCNNLHFLAWNVWLTIWRFWPIFLIATGLEYMLARRFKYGSLAVLIFMLSALAAAVVLHAAGRDNLAHRKSAAAATASCPAGSDLRPCSPPENIEGMTKPGWLPRKTGLASDAKGGFRLLKPSYTV